MKETNTADSADNKNRGRRILGILGIVLIVLAILVATYSLVVYSAWQQAEEDRIEEERRAFSTELENQLSLAREDINASNLELALRRLDWILDLNPGHEGAVELRAVVQSSLLQRVTPEVTATGSPIPTPSTSLEDASDPVLFFSELKKLYQNEQWLSAATDLASFQIQFPNFNRRETDQMLFDASINLGLELLQGDQIELGLYYFSQAEKLGNLPEAADAFRTWAELYLLGIGYFGVDWGQAIYYFRGLCTAAPYYQDSCIRLYESLVAYGDIFGATMEWCPAEELYFEAILYDANDVLNQKLDDARTNCLEATPTPTVAVTGTLTIITTPTRTTE